MLIALTGISGAGKDSVFKYLGKAYGFERLAFGDPVKQMAEACDPIVYFDERHDEVSSKRRFLRLSEYLKYCGGDWEVAKKNPEVRAFIQRMATEGVREVVSQTAWIDLLEKKLSPLLIAGKNVAVTDVRFPNEYALLKKYNCVTIRVIRPQYLTNAGLVHASEANVKNIPADLTIVNDESIAHLENQVKKLLMSHFGLHTDFSYKEVARVF